MAIVHNGAKRKLRQGNIALGFGLHSGSADTLGEDEYPDRTAQRGGGDDRARTVDFRASCVPRARLQRGSGPADVSRALGPGVQEFTRTSLAGLGQWPRCSFDRVPARGARSYRCGGDSARGRLLIQLPVP